RIDIVENRFLGMKSRGVYETPGCTLLLHAHRAVESITLDREVQHLRDELMPRFAEIIYNGLWFSPEREALQSFMDSVQVRVNGEARLKLYKGHVGIEGRRSDTHTLYDEKIATFEADDVYDQGDATGFIKLRALRLRTLGAKRISEGE
ncbi:MAG: argininosuccinate synthase, partial [bacterium]|nr:argininosuccinate synthase [bacterium]